MSELQRKLVQARIGRPPRPLGRPGRFSVDFTPVEWKEYFDSYRDVSVSEQDTFRVYLSGWTDPDSEELPLLLLLHGGGYSALTWSLFVKEVRSMCKCKVAAIDLRGHGDTRTSCEEDLSSLRLVEDVGLVYEKLLLDTQGLTDISDASHPNVVIIGHSMGGAIAVRVSSQPQSPIPAIVGLIVIDVVEGSAMEALQSMYGVISSRPQSFKSLESAIEWSLKSGQTRNASAAKVSMPGQLIYKPTGDTATKRILESKSENKHDSVRAVAGNQVIAEEAEDEEESVNTNGLGDSPRESKMSAFTTLPYCWRIDLKRTDIYWKGWFEGLSSMFISCQANAKFLLLAGIDRLDRELTIGQMQGKFQMQVLPQVGHIVHEDAPEKVAEAVATFLVRNKFAIPLIGFTPAMPGC